MKFKITYEYNGNISPHYFAVTEVKGERITRCGHTWTEAKQRLLEDLSDLVRAAYHEQIPVPEWVEVPIQYPEHQTEQQIREFWH
jgi:hypothetical protein